MAYQNVGTPRFYIDSLNWWRSLGMPYLAGQHYNVDGYDVHGLLEQLVGLNPSNRVKMVSVGDSQQYSYMTFKADTSRTKNFVAILGHNYLSGNCLSHMASIPAGGGIEIEVYPNGVVNYPIGNVNNVVGFNGWSLVRDLVNLVDELHIYTTPEAVATNDLYIGAIAHGTYYDMPHSPDLSLTMTREYGGIKTIETKGGASLSNTFYTKPAMWGDAGAWELYRGTPDWQKLSRSGRKIWDLSFSYLSDSDVFPDVSSLNNYETSGHSTDDGTTPTENTLLTDDNFFSQVIHKTNGGQLPFIFQPDGQSSSEADGSNPDQFAICKFDMKSFNFEQVANRVYNVKLKIREVW
jgi:hypothetical protein